MLSLADADLVARDRHVPGLATVLDADAFAEALGAVVPGMQVASARATYVRYKPHTHCLVAYEIEAAGVRLCFHASAYAPDGWRDKLRSGLGHATAAKPLAAGRLILEDRGIVISAFPNDDRLRAITRLHEPEARRRLLCKLLPGAPALWDGRLETVAYKPHRRYVARVVAAGGSALLKLYTSHGYSSTRAAAKRIVGRGALCVPRRLGRSRRHRVVAFEWLPGRLLADILVSPAQDLASLGRVAAALAELHTHRGRKLMAVSPDQEREGLLAIARQLDLLFPSLAGRARRLASALASLPLQEPPRRRFVHGDFYARQVLDDGATAAILDFDRARHGDPAADLGTFVAHLEWEVVKGRMAPALARSARDALLAGYEEAAGCAPLSRVDLHTAAALLRLTPHPFRSRQVAWNDQTQQILERAEAALAGAITRVPMCSRPARQAPATVSDPFRILDDAGLGVPPEALDPVEAARRLAAVPSLVDRHQRIAVEGIRVVRHKPGRRCLIEYELAVGRLGGGSKRLTALGKLRRRGVDTSAYGHLMTLWRTGFGADSRDGVAIPEPLGVIADFKMWLQRKAPGVPVTAILDGPERVALARRVAEAAHKLHRSGPVPQQRHTAADEVRLLGDYLSRLTAKRPEWAGRIEWVLAACRRESETLSCREPCGIHRDLHPDQVLVDGNRMYLLDLDLYAGGDAALDAGNFLAHITELSIRTLGAAGALADCERALEDRFLELAGRRARARVAAYQTLALARLVYLSTQHPDRQPFAATLLALCEERLQRPAR